MGAESLTEPNPSKECTGEGYSEQLHDESQDGCDTLHVPKSIVDTSREKPPRRADSGGNDIDGDSFDYDKVDGIPRLRIAIENRRSVQQWESK